MHAAYVRWAGVVVLFVGCWGMTTPQAFGVLVASDDLESNSLSGGSGWNSAWNVSGGSYVNGEGKIDDTYSLGLFGTSNASRLISPEINSNGLEVTLSFSLRADWDVVNPGGMFSGSEIGVNVLDGLSQTLFTMKFVQDNSQLLLNDGGSDFSIGTLTFGTGNVYDFTFTSEIGSDTYSFTADRRGSAESISGTNFGYNSRMTNSFGGLQFFVTAPTGVGNDGFIDSISVSAIPEASPLLLGTLVASLVGLVWTGRRQWAHRAATVQGK